MRNKLLLPQAQHSNGARSERRTGFLQQLSAEPDDLQDLLPAGLIVMHPGGHNSRAMRGFGQCFTPLPAENAFFVPFKLRDRDVPIRVYDPNRPDMGRIAAVQTNLQQFRVAPFERTKAYCRRPVDSFVDHIELILYFNISGETVDVSGETVDKNKKAPRSNPSKESSTEKRLVRVARIELTAS